MRPSGSVDPCSVQSVEVWTGVTYALAATMIHKVNCAMHFYLWHRLCINKFTFELHVWLDFVEWQVSLFG